MTKKIFCFLLPLLIIAQSAFAGYPPTTSKASGDSSDLVTFNYRFPNFAVTHSGPIMTLGILGLAGGGTNSTGAPLTKSAGYTLTANDDVVFVTATATMVLPSVSANTGKKFTIQTSGTSTLATISPASGTICGQATVKVGPDDDSLTFQSDGSNWVGLNNGCWRDESVQWTPTSAGTCTLNNSSHHWVASTTPNAGGDCTLNPQSGIFSVAPRCVGGFEVADASMGDLYSVRVYSSGTSAIRLFSQVQVGGSTTSNVNTGNAICKGPR